MSESIVSVLGPLQDVRVEETTTVSRSLRAQIANPSPGRLSTYELAIGVDSGHGGRPFTTVPSVSISRTEWESLKKGVDSLFEEYERRWPSSGDSP